MNMKNGFSTLNRLLGKKNKANGSTVNGNLSKSTTNLSLSTSTTNINEASQMQYNRITPLPVATSNAPFEQTFRITVLLPKDQLYVARLGARVPLKKLLELVCENKQLDAEKYEFRHPVDSSQVFNCNLTIGAVGLSEIRLCNKSESYDSFNADDIIKLHRTSIIRDSLSSSEFSSRHSKQTKTASPYSSSNSLNSMDSTGMNYNRTPVTIPQQLQPRLNSKQASAPVAPTRKKRMAPKPPSQNSIPEKSPLITNGNELMKKIENKKEIQRQPLPRKDFHVSSPNLYHSTGITTEQLNLGNNNSLKSAAADAADCNGNIESSQDHNKGSNVICSNGDSQQNSSKSIRPRTRPLSVHIFNQNEDHYSNHFHQNSTTITTSPLEKKNNALNLYSNSVQNLSTFTGNNQFPEPSPRKHILQVRKKIAPSPPPRTTTSDGKENSTNTSSSLRWTTTSTTTTTTTTTITTAMEENHSEELSKVDRNEKSQQKSLISEKVPDSSFYSERTIPDEQLPSPAACHLSLPQQQQQQQEEVIQDTQDLTPPPKPPHSGRTPPSVVDSLNSNEIVEFKTDQESCKPIALPRISPQKIESKPTTTTTTKITDQTIQNSNNVSKVLLNRTVTPEPQQSENSPEVTAGEEELTNFDVDRSLTPDTNTDMIYRTQSDDNISKQADSGIGEPVPSPIPESLPSENSATECKSPFESSSDDDEMIKVYNLKLGKTITKSLSEHKSFEDLPVVASEAGDADGDGDGDGENIDSTCQTANATATTPAISESTSWNFTIPAPPNFADNERQKNMEASNISPIPKENSKTESKVEILEQHLTTPFAAAAPPSSPNPWCARVVDELNSIINENRLDSIIRKSADDTKNSTHIESAKPNTLKNFSINAIITPSQVNDNLPTEKKSIPAAIDDSSSLVESVDEEKLPYRKQRGNIVLTNGAFKHRKSITRSDSFHSTYQNISSSSSKNENGNGLNSRSSSYISLAKHELLSGQSATNSRRSSSEMSIGESPGLQSLVVMKSILNSRKNSLNNIESQNSGVETLSNGCGDGSGGGGAEKKDSSADLQTTPKNLNEQSVEEVKKEEVEEVEELRKEASREPRKVYRYSGPPSINFSTWSERPRVQVSIKNEGDYIFGGNNGCPSSAVTTATLNITTKSTGGHSSRQTLPALNRASADSPKIPFVRSVEYKKTISMETPQKRYSRLPLPSLSNDHSKENQNYPSKPASMNNNNNNNYSASNKFILGGRLSKPTTNAIEPSVKGFRSGEFNNPQQQKQQQPNGFGGSHHHRNTINGNFLSGNFDRNSKPLVAANSEQNENGIDLARKFDKQSTLPRAGSSRLSTPPLYPPGPGLLRSTSITQYDAKPKSSDANVAPFSQVTLRKTGLKEKILATEIDDASKSDGFAETTTEIHSNSNRLEDVSDNKNKNISNNAELKFKPRYHSHHAKMASIKIAESGTPSSPPPPIIRAVLTKQNSIGGGGQMTVVNPREQLLFAIRNFKREDLNRAS